MLFDTSKIRSRWNVAIVTRMVSLFNQNHMANNLWICRSIGHKLVNRTSQLNPKHLLLFWFTSSLVLFILWSARAMLIQQTLRYWYTVLNKWRHLFVSVGRLTMYLFHALLRQNRVLNIVCVTWTLSSNHNNKRKPTNHYQGFMTM